jgi:aminoglycoside phosphotransferase family enzyme
VSLLWVSPQPARPPAAAPGLPFTLADKVRFLRQPASYSGKAAPVEVVETHRAWVFLAGDHVYKLKKPVVTPFLDYGTLAARGHCCAEEVRLNQRLAPGVYLRVAKLTAEDGRLAIDGRGEVVDWLVVMRRLPADRMLDAQIARGTLDFAEVARLGAVLAAFYRSAPCAELSPPQYRQRLRRDLEEHCEPLLAAAALLGPRERLVAVRETLRRFLVSGRDVVEGRVRDGRVVEGHGDLRPEHVCLLDPPVIFDCLEFNPRLRQVDAADELAYLAMECEWLHAPTVGPVLFAAYGRAAGDLPPPALCDFHAALRALLRAKLALWHLDGEPPTPRSAWVRRARRYLELAARHARLLR